MFHYSGRVECIYLHWDYIIIVIVISIVTDTPSKLIDSGGLRTRPFAQSTIIIDYYVVSTSEPLKILFVSFHCFIYYISSYKFHIQVLSSLVYTRIRLVECMFHHSNSMGYNRLSWEHRWSPTFIMFLKNAIIITWSMCNVRLSHWRPLQPGAHWHMFGRLQFPLFRHGSSHIAAVTYMYTHCSCT